MECDLPLVPHHDDIAILEVFDSADDGSMSDIEADQEAFNAVFPQAPTLASQHALRPLVDALHKLLATPEQLFVALLTSDSSTRHDSIEDLDALEATARTYSKNQLEQALSADMWQRITSFLKSRSNHHDYWTSPELVQQVDEMMLKQTAYYTYMWNYTCLAAAYHVHRVQSAVFDLHAELAPSIVGSETIVASIDRTAIDRPPAKLPPLESTSMYRPLRLRSHTAAALAAAEAATDKDTKTKKGVAARTNKTNKEDDTSAAVRRARIARKSNEFLIAWFLHHKAKPYPSQIERAEIAKTTGLTEQQVRNWFANMRKRHWKPKNTSKSKNPRCLLDTLLRKSDVTNA